MDQIIQPILCCIGHTVAGNAAHFALHRALASSGLDGCVISSDVSPQDFATAMAGIKVMRFSGLAVLPPHRSDCIRFLDDVGALALATQRVHVVRRIGERWHGEDLSLHAASEVLNHQMRGESATIGVHCHPELFSTVQSHWSSISTRHPSLQWLDPSTDWSESSSDRLLDGLILLGELPSKFPPKELRAVFKKDAFCVVADDSDSTTPYQDWADSMGLRLVPTVEYSAALHMHIFRYWMGKSLPISLFRDALDEYYAW